MKRKKILYIHQYFFHPGESGGTRTYWVSQELLKQGYKVTVITQKNPLNPFHKNKSKKNIERANIDGIDVIYIKNPYAMTFSVLRRIWAFFKFMIKSTWFALKEKETSLIIASSTPLSTGFPAIVAKKLKGIPFVFEVRDLWPEVPIQMGVIKNSAFIKLLRLFEKMIYKNASHINAFSPGMAEGIIKHIPPEKVTVIPNFSKIDKFWPSEKNKQLELDLGLSPESFKIIHFGAMGEVNGLDNFVEAAAKLMNKNSLDFEFILIGGGKKKAFFEERKKTEKLKNLHVFDRRPMQELSEVVNLCDVCYVGVSKHPILEINSANKFFDSLSAGKPIIINFGGWMQELIEEENCGIKVHSTDPLDLIGKIQLLRENEKLRIEMGKNARKLAEERFDKSVLAPKYVALLEKIALNKN